MTVTHNHEQSPPLKRSEQGLQHGVARHEAILAAALDPVVTIDAYGIVQEASHSVERVFGWSPGELVGRNVTVLMPNPYRSAHDDYLANYRDTGVTNIIGRPREFEAVRKDGTSLPIEISVWRVDVPGSDQPLFTGILRDITKRKRVEDELAQHQDRLEELVAERTAELEATHEQLRLADRLAAIGTLAAGLGHDMNNVLLPVRCRLDALDAARLPAEVKEHLDAVRSSTEYLQQLADGLHLLALDPDDPEASMEVTDLESWWKQVGTLLARCLPKHVTFTIALPDDLPEVAVAPHRLTQALLNLIVNAGEAVGEDGQVRLWATPFEDRRFVRLGVTDNGHGMTPEVKRRALDPFFTTKKRGLGTGLGLSLVRGVVQSAGGSIEIDSAPGEGTTVLLILPASSDSVAHTRHDEVDSAPLAVLSIGDRRTATFVATLLASAGFQVKHVEASDLCACALWIAEPSPAALEAVRKLHGEQRPRIVLFGRTSNEWKDLGATIIEDPADIDSIRQAISGIREALP